MAEERAVSVGERLVTILLDDKARFDALLARYDNIFPRYTTPVVYLLRAHANHLAVSLNVFDHERRKNAVALHRLLTSMRIDAMPFAGLASRVDDGGAMLERGRKIAWDWDYYFHIEIVYDDVPNAWMQDVIYKAPC